VDFIREGSDLRIGTLGNLNPWRALHSIVRAHTRCLVALGLLGEAVGSRVLSLGGSLRCGAICVIN
jgi:hypothetical protein